MANCATEPADAEVALAEALDDAAVALADAEALLADADAALAELLADEPLDAALLDDEPLQPARAASAMTAASAIVRMIAVFFMVSFLSLYSTSKAPSSWPS